jgi:energy-coupling factor transporter ATP-binding protein EcfA2
MSNPAQPPPAPSPAPSGQPTAPVGQVINMTASFVGSSTLTANPTVIHSVRIATITLRDFRAFPGGAAPEIFDFGANGKNLLLFGENGAGKSSVFHALRLLFSSTVPKKAFADYHHVFSKTNTTHPGLVAVNLTAGTPVDYTWDSGNPHPATKTGDTNFQEIARRAMFLDYKALLRTSLLHEDGDFVDLFDLVVSTLLREAEFPDGKTVSKSWEELLVFSPKQPPPRDFDQTEEDYAEDVKDWKTDEIQKKEAAENFWNMFTALLGRIIPKANLYLSEYLQPSLSIELTPDPDKQTDSNPRRKLLLTATYAGYRVEHPPQFLNEARLSAIALALYLAAVTETIPATTAMPSLSGSALDVVRPLRLLVLDDPLLGLDLSHRRPLLDLLQRNEFADWHILLLTYDASWFEMAGDVLDAGNAASDKRWVAHRLHAKLHEAGWEMPVLTADAPFLDRAWEYQQSGDQKAAGVYLRSAFETMIREFCIARSLQVGLKENLRDYTSEDLWPIVRRYEVKNGQPLVDERLIGEITLGRRYVLNPLCHNDPSRPTREEVRRAHAALTSLKTLLDQDLIWRKFLENKFREATKDIIGDNAKRREKALKGLAPANEFSLRCACQLLTALDAPKIEITLLLRSAFDRMLWRYCARKNLTFTHKCDEEFSTQLLWDSAKAGATGLGTTHAAFVAAIEAQANILLVPDPTKDVCTGKTLTELESLCVLFAGANWKTETNPKASMDSF